MSGPPLDTNNVTSSPATLVQTVLHWAKENRSKLALVAAMGVSTAAVCYLIQQRAGITQQDEGSTPDDTVRLDFAQVLPEELTLNIFYRCRAEDFVRAAQVCKEWHRLCDDDTIWKEIYRRKWRKVEALLSLRHQTRMRPSWKDLYIERDSLEKAYFHNPHVPDELKADERAQADHLFQEARHQYTSAVEDTNSGGLPKMAYAIIVLAISGEMLESLHLGDPTNYQLLWNWAHTLNLQATWTSQLLTVDDSSALNPLVEHTNWLYELACEKYEMALALAPRNTDGLFKHLIYADFCAGQASKKSGERADRYFHNARLYFRKAIERAQAVEHKRLVKTTDGKETVEVDTFQDTSAIARGHRGIGSVCLSSAEKLYESITAARSDREKRAVVDAEGEAAQEGETEKEKEKEKEKEELARLLEILRDGRENMMACVKLEPDQMEHLIVLGDILCLLGEMVEDADESETYFNEGVINFERVLAIDDTADDALNEYGILLTKRAQRVLKQLRLEGLHDLADDENVDTTAAPVGDHSAGERAESQDEHGGRDQSVAAAEAKGESEKEPITEEEEEMARRRARRREMVSKANRYFDAAEAKFRTLHDIGVWFGGINLACLAALRGREESAKRWLYMCRDLQQLSPENLDDRDFDAYRERDWFVELREALSREREEREREQELAREREAEERRRMEEEAAGEGPDPDLAHGNV